MTLPPPPAEYAFKRSLRAGFTLVEIAIVLVIIGLIVGGIMVGADLIRVARLRSQTSQINQYKAAVATFQLKYNCLPGDCYANALQFGLPTVNDGLQDDGFIENGYSYFHVAEEFNFWAQLSAAGLGTGGQRYPVSLNGIQDSTTYISDFALYFPLAKIGSGYIVVAVTVTGAGFGALPPTMGNSYVITGRVSCASVLCYSNTLTPMDAKALDDKMDDGSPVTGQMQVLAASYWADADDPNLGVAGCTTWCDSSVQDNYGRHLYGSHQILSV